MSRYFMISMEKVHILHRSSTILEEFLYKIACQSAWIDCKLENDIPKHDKRISGWWNQNKNHQDVTEAGGK